MVPSRKVAQVEQKFFFSCGWVLQQLNQISSLLGRQRQWRNAQRCALGNVLAIGLKHEISLDWVGSIETM